MSKRQRIAAAAALVALVLVAYGNHFHNGFHFDDEHAIVDNPAVRDLRNVPRFFTDATSFSILPLNQSYRPVLQTTFALDYGLGGGYRPVAFQIDTFVWFLALLAAVWLLTAQLLRRAGSQHSDATAAVATAIYGLHPACAETVNYVVQRGDLLSTFGVVAALALFAWRPAWRRFGAYLVLVGFALLAKPPAVVFPLLLVVYVVLSEGTGPVDAARAAVPSLVLVLLVVVWMQVHTPATYTTGAVSKISYWVTQPFVAMRYFGGFVLPVDLSADNDWPLLGLTDARAWTGVAFVVALVWLARLASRRPEDRPIAFGLWWFLITLLPTSVLPLAEVANDHRMFFPFVGLSLSAAAAGDRVFGRLPASPVRTVASVLVLAAVLAAETAGVRARNRVWASDETLWYDVTVKSPHNGRGWMNYGLARMARGDYSSAIEDFERALVYAPFYSLAHVNLGIAYGGVGRIADAEREFQSGIALAPADWRSHLYYGRWLLQAGRPAAAAEQLELALHENPEDPAANQLLAQAGSRTTPESLLVESLLDYQAGRFRDCIRHAERALAIRPDYAEAFNNIAAGHNALAEWDAGIRAAEEAVRLKPDFVLARNNLEYARARKASGR